MAEVKHAASSLRGGSTFQDCGIAVGAAGAVWPLPLPALQPGLDIAHRPVLAGRDDPDTAVVGPADEGVRADVVIDALDLDVGVRLPVERCVEIAGIDPPNAPVVELDDVAFGVRSDLKGLPRC